MYLVCSVHCTVCIYSGEDAAALQRPLPAGGQGQEGTGAGGSGGRQRVHSAGVAPGPGGGAAHRHQATGTGRGGAVQEGGQCAGFPQEGAQPVGPGEGAGLGQGHPGRAGWSGAPRGRGAPPGRQGGGGGGAAGQARHLPPGQAGRDGGGAQRPGKVQRGSVQYASCAFDRPSGSPPKSGWSTAKAEATQNFAIGAKHKLREVPKSNLILVDLGFSWNALKELFNTLREC